MVFAGSVSEYQSFLFPANGEYKAAMTLWRVPKGGIVVLYTEGGPVETKTKVPDLTGLSITQVNRTAAAAGINVKISGNTLVNSELTSYGQSIAKGESVDYGTTVTVYFKSNTGVSDSPG